MTSLLFCGDLFTRFYLTLIEIVSLEDSHELKIGTNLATIIPEMTNFYFS